MGKERHFDVVVVGAGITGLVCAQHLQRLGVGRVGLASASPAVPPVTAAAAGLLLGGQFDNFTRVSHAHGADFGAALWRFGDVGFDAALAYCVASGVPVVPGRRVRLITSEPELVEARRAVAELHAAGLPAVLTEPATAHPLGVWLRERVLAVQDEGPRAAWVDVGRLLASLAAAVVDLPRLPAVQALVPHAQGLEVRLQGGATATCELAVVAAHLGTGTLIPELAPALVSVADQWSEIALAPAAALPEAGLCFSANHTYEWGAIAGPGRLSVGGGRYLRPMAGIEAKVAVAEPRIATHLLSQLQKTFTFADGAKLGAARAALDIRPCDELPVIGPMFGGSRLLVATGFMSSGLALGFHAGKALAELIQTGRAETLPRGLWPERLRTLEG